jgi:heat shock protein HslJ
MSSTPFILALAILSGTEWVSTGPVEQTLSFEEGKIATHTGCNRAFGDYAESGAELTLNVVGMTKMACMDDARSNAEQDWLELTKKVAGFKVENGELILTDADGQSLATLKSK